MGRSSKISEKVISELSTAIRQGATYELASNYAGITYRTFRNWMKKGEELSDEHENEDSISDEDKTFFQFFHALKKAEGQAAVKWLLLIEKAAQDDNWQAAAWKLERRYKQYRRETDVEKEETRNWTDKMKIIGLNKNAI